MPLDGAGKHHPFEIAAFLNQVLYLVAMRDPSHVLLDNRTFVENVGDVMTGGADQLYSPLIRGVVRTGSRERGQKRVVDVDDAAPIPRHESGREYLHIAGQHHELDSI